MSFIVKAVTGVVKAVVSVVTSVVKAVVNVVADVINFVAAPFMALLGIKMPNAGQEAARQEGVLLQKNGGGSVPIPVVYGYRKVGGIVTYCETGSDNNKYLWVAYTFSEGPVEGIFKIFIDDNELSTTVVNQINSGLPVVVPDPKYKNRVVLQWYDGRYFNNPADSPVGTRSILTLAPSWKQTNAFNGMATLFARFEWKEPETQEEADANPFSGNIPNVQIGLLGKKVASLRSGANSQNSEYGGTGYTERYSTNPAECLLDYLRNPRYGKGLKNSDIDWSSFYTAAAKCNQEIAYSGAVQGPILTMNYVVDTDQTLFNNVKNMLINFRAYMPYVQGKYKLKIEDAGNPTDITSGAAEIAAVFTRDNIVGDISYTGIDRSAKATQVKVTYVDPDQKFSNQEVVYPATEAERQVYINYDGGRENTVDITLSGVTNQQIARDFARLAFMKSRYQETCSLRVTAQGFNLEPGDNIYIQSNILNFGETPWRIISLKLNNDYTFDLGCVRNPDFIYPYIIPNTPDKVIAPYIPKGAAILQPLAGGGSLVGLTPPITARRPTTVTVPPGTPGGNLNNSPATAVTGPTGGGVGGDGGTINDSGGAQPETPPVVNILKDFVTLDSAVYSVPQPNVGYVDITFKQPAHPMYESLIFYYKRNTAAETIWNKVEITDKPGASGVISYKLGPLALPNLNTIAYDIRTRVKYSTGEYSTIIGKSQLIFDSALTASDPVDFQEVVGSGWDLPTSGVRARNDYPGSAQALTVLSDGISTTQRKLNVSVQQELSLRAVNPDISGVRVFYKASDATYWQERTIDFGTYTPGTKIAFQLTNLGLYGDTLNWDFILRYTYSDNTQSSEQVRFMTRAVEFAGTPPQDAFYGGGILEAASSFGFMTVEQAVQAGLIPDVRDMKIGLAAFFTSAFNGVPGLQMHVVPPDASVQSSWVGVRVYYRKVQAGTNTAQTQIDIIGANRGNYNSIVTRYFTLAVEYDVEYQYLIVPLVFYSGQIVEGNFSWIGQAAVHARSTATDYPTNNNWISAFNWRQDQTSALKGQLSTAFPSGNPFIVYSEWSINSNNRANNDDPTYANFVGGVNGIVNTYYNIVFDIGHVVNFKYVHIYRRDSEGILNTGNYYGLGRWEKITLSTAFAGYDAANKRFTVKLKPPTSRYEFDPYGTATNPYWTRLTNPPTNTFVEVKPSKNHEFWFVIETNDGVSNKAIKLQGTNFAGGDPSTIDLRARFGPVPAVAWPLLNPNPYPSAFQRNMNQARTGAVNTTPINHPNTYYYGTGFDLVPVRYTGFTQGAI